MYACLFCLVNEVSELISQFLAQLPVEDDSSEEESDFPISPMITADDLANGMPTTQFPDIESSVSAASSLDQPGPA